MIASRDPLRLINDNISWYRRTHSWSITWVKCYYRVTPCFLETRHMKFGCIILSFCTYFPERGISPPCTLFAWAGSPQRCAGNFRHFLSSPAPEPWKWDCCRVARGQGTVPPLITLTFSSSWHMASVYLCLIWKPRGLLSLTCLVWALCYLIWDCPITSRHLVFLFAVLLEHLPTLLMWQPAALCMHEMFHWLRLIKYSSEREKLHEASKAEGESDYGCENSK